MPAWAVWAAIAVGLGIAEVFTLTLVLGLAAVAGVVAGVAALSGAGAAVQLLLFIAGTVLLLGVVRPVAVRHRRSPAVLRTGVAALVGSTGTVIERIDGGTGQVKIGGEIWTARCLLDGRVIESGASVQVASIAGATAVVFERETL